MKKLLLLTVVSAIACQTFAQTEANEPKILPNSIAYSMSENAQYVISQGYTGTIIFDLISGQSFVYTEESENGLYTTGFGRCVSDNGIVIGYEWDEEAQYWKDGEWTPIKIPANATSSNLINSISADGRRICGSIGVSAMSFTDDRLMQAPCVWNWDDNKGDFGDPIMLPHPQTDFMDRIPMYISAIDISADGKTIVGQVTTSVGNVYYPIIYKEDEKGEWSYIIPDWNVLHPEGAVIPEYPGDLDIPRPTEESFMTQEEIERYQEAYEEYINSGDTLPAPKHSDFMTAEEIAAYNKAAEEYNKVATKWEEEFNAFTMYYYEKASKIPAYEFNAIRISPDGKTYANSYKVESEDPLDPFGGNNSSSFILVSDIESGAVTKYDQQKDFVLSTALNDGVAIGITMMGVAPQSYVLAGGKCTSMYDWMAERNPAYAEWLKNTLTVFYEEYVENEEGDVEILEKEAILTGRAIATPDMSTVVLGIENVWDLEDDGISVVFDMNIGDGVGSVVNSADSEKTIYDLGGRKLKNSDASGICIINGKKVIR